MFRNKSFDNKAPLLYLVATPIGNLQEMSNRALNVLKEMDVIAAEDTRNTFMLLSQYGIKKELFSLREHNELEASKHVIELLKSGKKVAYVSDAGYPGISDPGYLLVKTAIESGISVSTISGSSAFINALVASGLPTDHFYFYGFLSKKGNDAKKALEDMLEREETLIFYESPHHIKETILLMSDIFQDREAVIARELTKLNEEYNLKQSYLSCLEMAQDFGLSSIAFPLLSTGAYEFPKREAIKIAVDTITDFLDDNDLDVALVIYKENTYKTYKDIFKKYTIVGGHLNKQDEASMEEIIKERRGFKWYKSGTAKLLENGPESKALRHQLEYFMAQKGLSRTDCYSGAISKTAFNNIMAGAIPSKNTIVSLGINMGLDVYEINQLLSPLGECLDYEIERDVYIIRGIQKGMDLKCINELLVGKGFVPLKTNYLFIN